MKRTYQRIMGLVAGVSALAIGAGCMSSKPEIATEPGELTKPKGELIVPVTLAQETETVWVREGAKVKLELPSMPERATVRWLRNGEVVSRDRVLTIHSASLANVAHYTSEILGPGLGGARASGSGAGTAHSQVVALGLVSTQATAPFANWTGQPLPGSGVNGTCGNYVGYLVFRPSSPTPPPWGFSPSTNWVGPYTAACTSDTNACVCYTSNMGRTGCQTGSVTLPSPKPKETFRFGVYFNTALFPATCTLQVAGF